MVRSYPNTILPWQVSVPPLPMAKRLSVERKATLSDSHSTAMFVITVSEWSSPAEESDGAHWLASVEEYPTIAFIQHSAAVNAVNDIIFILSLATTPIGGICSSLCVCLMVS